ncbi:hypothetical protein [Paenibacillus jilunlii]|uniref:Uncharacterized protein n=1 Tax=Paenibacillus jilunlii TaxID=682956 RepID=A0A1G9SB78_9BACL|nr:hypothetical protein [Paenibacillus jilunlii]KWX75335.1 hypothetical protein AML91_12805 [Paenibacillus jilunlii]SDM32045.1 hypothetical protein SAMN05216191_111120 [Paenibacillus jilunlii]
MAVLSTGPIENNAVLGVRPTQLLTVKAVCRNTVEAVSMTIQGYVLGTTRTLYVNEVLNIAPNEVVTRNYFADLDGFEFIFTTGSADAEAVGISVWGKQSSGQLVDAHRVVERENTNRDA